MPQRSLADFLEQLAGEHELARVSAEVDGELEIAEITRRVSQQQGPALLFERVRGQSIAVVTNLLGTSTRACRALGIDSLDDIGARIEALVERHTPQNWFDRLRMSGEDTGVQKFRAKPAKNGPCQQVVRLGRDIDLAALPLIKSWPAESATSLTAGLIVTRQREAGHASLSQCPLVAADAQRLAVIDDGNSLLAQHMAEYRSAGEKMPVAIFLGGDPAALLAAQFDVPASVDAFQAIGLLRGAPLETVKCRTHDLQVPADADVVLEGYWDPQAEGASVSVAAPGGSHYWPIQVAPAVQLTAISHRSHPLWPTIVDGCGGERCVLSMTRERALLSLVKSLAPDVLDLHLPALGGVDRFAVASLTKRRPFQARQIAAALWSMPSVGRAKFLIIVDATVNVRELNQVWAAVGAHVAPERDLFWHDAPASGADYANTLGLLGRHVAIDATSKIAGEGLTPPPAPLAAGQETCDLVAARWAEYKLELGVAVK